MAGKALLPSQEHINRLIVISLQFDFKDVKNPVIARTDSEVAALVVPNFDEHDYLFILQSTEATLRPLVVQLHDAEKGDKTARGLISQNVSYGQAMLLDWDAPNMYQGHGL
ncbi:isocitrate lyase family-domain-containing protein [Lenzites betulinus]|nr:isocitrate lyase family-domain-containing protein [Lenzites betulinus]